MKRIHYWKNVMSRFGMIAAICFALAGSAFAQTMGCVVATLALLVAIF